MQWDHRINKAHQQRAQTLLDIRDERMTTTLQRDKDIILIPRDWWKDKAESLEPVDLGWWYTVNKVVKSLRKEYKGCAEIFQGPIKTGGKRTVGKGKQPMTKRM
jgi:hypothetical protein